MVDKETARLFIGKNIQIERLISGRAIFSKGTLTQVGETDILLNFNESLQAYSLDYILSIREVGE